MTVVGVELMALGIHFENCGDLRAHVPGLLFYLGIDVELGQEGLDITLVLDGQKSTPEVLSEGQILVDFSLDWWLSNSSNFDDVPVLLLSSSGLWLTHCPLTERCYLHHQYYFTSLVLFPTTPFGPSRIQVGRYLI